MAGETVVETPQDNTKVDEPVKSDKEAIVEEEKAAEAADEEKKDEEKADEEVKKPEKKAEKKAEKGPSTHVKEPENDMVYVFQFTRSPVIPSISPFCLKLESWLKMMKVPYTNVDHKCKFRSKKGLLPFVELNGEEIADSNKIIEVLAKKLEKEMPAELTQDQKNVQHAMVAMVENHLHWTIVHWRSSNTDNILKGYHLNLQTAIKSKVPASLLNFYFKYTFCRRGLKKVKGMGLGVHSAEEIQQFGKDDLTVLSEMMGEKEFFFGSEPAMLDLVVFSHVAQLVMIDPDYACPLRDHLQENCKNLVGLVERMKERCWGEDWATATGEEMDLNPHIPKPVPEVVEEPAKEEEKKEEDKKEETTEKEEKKEEEKEKADEKTEEKEKADDKKEDENKESEEKK
jgi:glutathione S-transferase